MAMRVLRGIGRAPLLAVAAAIAGLRTRRLVGKAGDRDDLLAILDLEEHHALGLTAGDADVRDRAADELAAVGHQHDLVAMTNGEARHDLAVAGGHLDGRNAGAAAPGDPVGIGGTALAEPFGSDRQNELLLGLELSEAFRRECYAVGRISGLLFDGLARALLLATAPLPGQAQIRDAL